MIPGIYAVIDFKLIFPYPQSAEFLVQLCNLWSCKIITLSTKKPHAIIMMPWKKFKIIFGRYPRIDNFDIPANTEHFLEEITVKEVKAI